MRFDLVVNTFVKDAVLRRKLSLHGGGWIWRPLVDVEDVAAVHVEALAAPLDHICGQIQCAQGELSDPAARDARHRLPRAPRSPIRVELEQAPLPSLVRNYRMSDAKLTACSALRPPEQCSKSVEYMLGRLLLQTRSVGEDRFYNIRWMRLLETVHAEQPGFETIY